MILLIASSNTEERLKLGPEAVMRAQRVPFDPGDPRRVRAGALSYLGGVTLDSPDPAFGGFSAMLVAGDRFTLVSDGGNIVRFRMGADWQVREARFGDVAEGPGNGRTKSSRDVEAIVADPGGAHVWAAFEKYNEIWRYGPDLARSARHAAPPLMKDWGANGGAESFVRLADGSFVAIAETARLDGIETRAALRFLGDPADPATRAYSFAYLPPEGFNPSDAVQLPDGRLLVLNRRVEASALLTLSFRSLFSARLMLVDPREIAPGARVRGREIAAIGAPFTRDNLEALAVVREGKDTILWIASDDNRAWYQRSLLMKFRLELPPPEKLTPQPKPS